MIDREDLIEELRRLADGDTPPSKREMKEAGVYSVTTYRRRFGSWNDAVETAGFDPRPIGDQLSTEALLDEIRRLAHGHSPPTQAEMDEKGEYGVSTYHQRLGSWSDAVAEAGFVPHPPIAEGKTKIPSDELLAELRRVADGDDPPTEAAMRATGTYSVGTYRNRFGSWSEAVEAAGLDPQSPGGEGFTEAELLDELRRLADGDTAPTIAEMTEDGEYSAATYQQRFGSWNDAVEAAGLDPRSPGGTEEVSDEELLAELRRLADGDTPPTQAEMNRDGEHTASTYSQRFGSWNDAVEVAGFKPLSSGKIPDAELLAELRRLADGDDPPTQAEMNDDGEYSAATYQKRFGSWNDAVAEAGFPPRAPISEGKEKIPSDKLLAELQRLADGDTAPSKSEMTDKGEYASATYLNRFGSWANACEEADLTPRTPHN